MLDNKIAKKILKTYGEAWMQQDVNKISSIFTKDGIYHERVLEKPMKGNEAIRLYWKNKIIKDESDIKFKLLNYYISGNILIAEWKATFIYKKTMKVKLIEVAILEIEKNKIKSLREYWHSKTDLLS